MPSDSVDLGFNFGVTEGRQPVRFSSEGMGRDLSATRIKYVMDQHQNPRPSRAWTGRPRELEIGRLA